MTTTTATTAAAADPTFTPVSSASRPYMLLSEIVGPNGDFLPREKFKGSEVKGGAYILRKGVIDTIRLAGPQLNGLTLKQRITLFRFVQQEGRRYFGTAVRRMDTVAGPKGSVMPQLQFASKAEAVAYNQALQGALAALRATHPSDA